MRVAIEEGFFASLGMIRIGELGLLRRFLHGKEGAWAPCKAHEKAHPLQGSQAGACATEILWAPDSSGVRDWILRRSGGAGCRNG